MALDGEKDGVGHRLLIAAVVVVLAAAVVIWTSPDRTQAPVGGNRVLVVGDSLMEGAKDEVDAQLRSDGWEPAIDAVGGTNVETWQERIGPDGEFLDPDVAVVELGTNDCDSSCPDLAPLIDRIIHELSDDVDSIIWLTVQEEPTYPRNAEHVNLALREASVRHPGLHLVDFGQYLAGHPEWHQSDGLHLNDAGSEAMADFIAEALAQHAPRS